MDYFNRRLIWELYWNWRWYDGLYRQDILCHILVPVDLIVIHLGRSRGDGDFSAIGQTTLHKTSKSLTNPVWLPRVVSMFSF